MKKGDTIGITYTGEWKTKAQAKTHDGKELPYFVVKVGG